MFPEQVKFKVKALTTYPIKGAQGTALQSTLLTVHGFNANRTFMLLTREGNFVNQLTLPTLNQLVTEIVPGGIKLTVGSDRMTAYMHDSSSKCSFNLYGSTGVAFEFGDTVNEWLTAKLGQAKIEKSVTTTSPLRLVRIGQGFSRRKEGALRPYRNFADRFELSIHTNKAEQELNGRIVARGGAALPSGRASRFRTNLILEAPPGWSSPTENPEDAFACLRFPNRGVVGVGNMIRRCAITLKDQEGRKLPVSDKQVEPLRTLATYRRFDPADKPEAKRFFPDGDGAYFASYAQIHEFGDSEIAVGDEVTVELRPQAEIDIIVAAKK